MWVKLDDGFAEHPKVLALSDRALRLHIAAMCWSARRQTDGAIPAAYVREKISKKFLDELLCARLWDRDGADFKIHDFLDYNPSRDQHSEERQELSRIRALAGKRGAESRWRGQSKPKANVDGNCHDKPDGNCDRPPKQKHGPVPVPHKRSDPKETPPEDLTGSARAEAERAGSEEAKADRAPTGSALPVEPPAESRVQPSEPPPSEPPKPPSSPPANASNNSNSSRTGSNQSEPKRTAPAAKPTGKAEPVRILGAHKRSHGARPTVAPQEFATNVSPREIEVPVDFERYAQERGLDRKTYGEALLDWREKTRPSTYVRLFDVLCRFIEARAARASNPGTVASVQAPLVPWTRPNLPPPDPNPPPPNPVGLSFPRGVSNG